MGSAELLADAFGRAQEEVHAAVDGLSPEQLAVRLDDDANSIAWLCWHLTRVQDDHVAGGFGVKQVWPQWRERFGLGQNNTRQDDIGGNDIGYGHSSRQVAQIHATADLLTGYYDAVHEQTIRLASTVTDADLERIVDERWNPPVTLGVRLVSVISDCLQHVGQAAFVRGIVLRRARG